MKTTTILLLIAAAGLATGCRNNKEEDRYSYSETTYRTSDPYNPADTRPVTTTSTTTSVAPAPSKSTDSGTTIWYNTQADGQPSKGANGQPAQGQDQSKQDAPKQKTQLNAQDQEFVKQATLGGQKEIEMGRLAVRQASNERVRQFGQTLVDDHTKAKDELASMARQRNVDMTSVPRPEMDRTQIEKLGQLQGADFDKQFIDQMVQSHQKTIELFDREARTGEDAQLKAFAARTLPTLRSHLQMAKDIQISLGAADMGVPRAPATPRDPNQPTQPFDPNNPAPANPNNPDPMNPSNPR